MSIIQKLLEQAQIRYYGKKGFSPYYVTFWRKEMLRSYKNSDLPRKIKRWAFDRGFKPFHYTQYGLTEENYRNIISDRDYFYLYPLNCRYKSWIDDKLTMKYVLAPFDKYLPRYYYHIMKERGVMRLMDCPKEFEGSAEGLMNLLKEKRQLAVKMAGGTYGIGFYKIESKDGKFYANGKEYDEAGFKQFLLGLDDYIITEFVEMHHELKKLYPDAVNTIRVMVINEHGNDPIVPFAYMRIGTKKSGIVDNVAQGGMFCRVNAEDGHYYDGETAFNHVVTKIEYHPDTHEKIDGYLPNWDIVKRELVNMSLYCPQLKWLGYDIAITEDGFSIIEINSHQGLHKAHEYDDVINGFLFRELKKKKEKYHIK